MTFTWGSTKIYFQVQWVVDRRLALNLADLHKSTCPDSLAKDSGPSRLLQVQVDVDVIMYCVEAVKAEATGCPQKTLQWR